MRSFAVVLLAMLACGRASPPAAQPARTTERPHAETRQAQLARPFPTETLVPERHRIRIEDLPPPHATESARNRPDFVTPPPNARLRAPAGFSVNIYADSLDEPRWLALTPAGEVLVTETRNNRILLLADRDGDGAAEVRYTFADDEAGQRLDIPFGMAFAGEHFFVGSQDEVRAFRYARGQQRIEGGGTRITELPGGGYRQHWTRNVVAAPDGEHLYVSVGSASDHDPEPAPRASVLRMRLDGTERTTFASGLRNPVGLAFHPRTGVLWTTVNERDHLGNELVPDYLAALREGDFFGWPWVYLQPDLRDPRLADRELPEIVSRTRAPDVLFEAHSAPLGLVFYAGASFPERYRGGAFVAFRGSWNRELGTGYGVAFVPFDAEGRPLGHYEDFLVGFQLDRETNRVFGRPVGLLVAPDGSLLVTDEPGGRIYRVSYER